MDKTKNTLQEWLEFIESLHPSEIQLGLKRISLVAEHLGLLGIKSKVILVAGTNGKGSCCAMLESLAITHQKSVGCYTSPHLVTFNERIRVNGENVDDQTLVNAFKKVASVQQQTKLTFFEYTTLAALLIFQSEELDLVILEIGLGGRQDACNIIEPDVSVITTIARDHVDWLGEDLVGIAYEKAGIIRLNKPAIVGDQKSLDLVVRALEKNDNWEEQSRSYDIRLRSKPSDKIRDALQQTRTNPKRLLSQNVQLAIDAFDTLFGSIIKDKSCVKALQNIHLMGRFQVSEENRTILDVAHNLQSGENLASQLAEFKSVKEVERIIAVCGMMADKSISEFFGALSSVVDEWIFVDLPLSRAASAESLSDIYIKTTDNAVCRIEANLSNAYQICQSSLKPNEWLLVTGSFVTVGQVVSDLG